jgi:hypothetical protein
LKVYSFWSPSSDKLIVYMPDPKYTSLVFKCDISIICVLIATFDI